MASHRCYFKKNSTNQVQNYVTQKTVKIMSNKQIPVRSLIVFPLEIVHLPIGE